MTILLGLTVSRTEFFMEKTHLGQLEKTALECQRLFHPKLPWGNAITLNGGVKIKIALNPESKCFGIWSYVTKKVVAAHASVNENCLGFSCGILPAKISKRITNYQEEYTVPTWVANKAVEIVKRNLEDEKSCKCNHKDLEVSLNGKKN